MDKKSIDNIVSTALQNHKKGYNCSQAVACAFARYLDMDERTLFKITEGLGFGMGNGEGTCGAISAAAIISGIIHSTCDLNAPNSKAISYKWSKSCLDKFKSKNSSIICKELKGISTGNILRSCDGCIEDAASIIATLLP